MKITETKILHKILKSIFPLEEIPTDIDNLKIGDFNSWDSLGNFNLLLAIEDFYKIKFSLEEIGEIKSIIK